MEDNIRELEESLQRLPEDLDRTYDDALERIKAQHPRKRARADQILMLISCTTRPLILAELQQLLSIRKGDTFMDQKALPETGALISACCGLVVVEEGSQIVKLVHSTTEEYFSRKPHHYWGPEAHQYFAGVLVTYLSFTTFANLSLDNISKNAVDKSPEDSSISASKWTKYDEEEAINTYMESSIKNNILLRYAAENWGPYARIALTDSVFKPENCLATADSHNGQTDNSWNLKQLIPDFLARKSNVACANLVLRHVENARLELPNLPVRGPTDVTSLQMASLYGIRYFVEYYISQGEDIDARDSEGLKALHKAAKNGHLEVVRLLINSGGTIETLDRRGYNALVWAVIKDILSGYKNHFLRIENFDDCRHLAISLAACFFSPKIFEILAAYETDDSKTSQLVGDALYDTALVDAARRGNSAVVSSLLFDGLYTALAGTVRDGNTRMMNTLWRRGRSRISSLFEKVENEGVNKTDFHKEIKLAIEAQSPTRHNDTSK